MNKLLDWLVLEVYQDNHYMLSYLSSDLGKIMTKVLFKIVMAFFVIFRYFFFINGKL